MSWKTVVLIATVSVSVVGIISLVVTNLRTIMNTIKEGLNIIRSGRYKREQTWPFAIEILDVKVEADNSIGSVWVKFHLNPREEAVVDSCVLEYVSDLTNVRPVTPIDIAIDPEWIVGKSNRLQRDVEMYFSSRRLGGDIRIKIGSESRVCLSNIWRIGNATS